LFSVAADPGAGGTTQARALAFAAAKAGFPSLLVQQQSEPPTALEITSFLYRAISAVQAFNQELSDVEPAWLLVFDVQHFDGDDDDLWRFFADLVRSGRKVVVLKVVRAQAPLQPPSSIEHEELTYVSHELDRETVVSLGNHLNVFLRHHGKEKSLQEWTSFWEAHRPDIDTGIASFWVALEFWLAGYLELGESIQGWIHTQFRQLNASPQVKQAILEIAAFSIERRALPERLLAPLSSPRIPWSEALDEARRLSPGLGLVQAYSVPFGRVWAVAHDVLARYLVNATWSDRRYCQEIGLFEHDDTVALRLHLISRVTQRSSFGEPFARPLAVALATNVIKLDEKSGSAEYFRHWKTVLSVLDGVPATVKTACRTFNHHLAISRRRATQLEIFQATTSEKKDLLLKAAKEVLFSIERIAETPEDEPDLNLYNTLALIYQDLATLERSPDGDKAKLTEYLLKSDEATRNALKENPNNSYVLETAARNLLQQDYGTDESRKVEAAAEAMSFVFQAASLDTATERTLSLGRLATKALALLRSPLATNTIDSLCRLGNPFGFVARAWLLISDDNGESGTFLREKIPSDRAVAALEVLKASPKRDWLLVRLQYELVVASSPLDLEPQLLLLDELADSPGYRLSLQQRLERAVLLYQQGRHEAAGDEFHHLRRDVRVAGAILNVPDRLRWLLNPGNRRRAICSARVVDRGHGKPMAQVVELGRAVVPFAPQEFAKSRMIVGELFKCYVNFSAMGPFLKPIDSATR
jgi:hypothetical protein